MLIDDTQKEETRVVILDGNKIEDVEFDNFIQLGYISDRNKINEIYC